MKTGSNFYEHPSLTKDIAKNPQDTISKKIQNYIFSFGDLLGQGNFSKVYKGYHQTTKEMFAIKIVQLNSLKSKKLEELLFSEIDILKKINHPNILKCHEVFTSNRNCYIITELCNQGDLESKLKAKKVMKEDQAEHYIKGIFKGLLYLAQHGIIHRDIKVSNIFIHKGQAKIADFGFAKATKMKFKDINIGSPIYMSPEGFIDNIYGPKTDIWAFGVLIYELLHGHTPFSNCKSQNQLRYNMSIPVGWSQLKADLSTEIKEIILKCMQIDEAKRISATELSKLTYFRDLTLTTPSKNRRDFRAANYSTDINKFTHHLQMDKSQSDQFSNQKYRIKTENEGYSRQINRQFSSGYELDRSPLKTKADYHSFLKTAIDDDANNSYSHSHSHNSFSSTNFRQNYLNRIGGLHKIAEQKTDNIISSKITFRECVNILHYCRLLYKHLILMKEMTFGDDNQRSIFKRWLGTVIKALMREIQQKRVICDGQNVANRERKLRQVTNEYIKKYTRQLQLDLSKIKGEESAIINYDKICNYFYSIYQLIQQLLNKDMNNKLLMQLGHSMVMIVFGSRLLKKCYEEKYYGEVEKLKDIEEFLCLKKEELSYQSYKDFRKKYL